MSHALNTAKRNTEYVRLLEREIRRLRKLNEKLAGEAMAAKTAAAHLREALAAVKAEQ